MAKRNSHDMTARCFWLLQSMILCAEAREEAERGTVFHETTLATTSLQSLALSVGVCARPMPCNLMADVLVSANFVAGVLPTTALDSYKQDACMRNHPIRLGRASHATETFR